MKKEETKNVVVENVKNFSKNFVNQFTVGHTVKHIATTTLLTLLSGDWVGAAVGGVYCVGDTVAKVNSSKTQEEIIGEFPEEMRTILRRACKLSKKKFNVTTI